MGPPASRYILAVPAASPSDLASAPLFAALSEPELAQAAEWFDVRAVAAGVRLVGEGTTGLSFFVILDGSATVTSGGGAVATLGPGDFFGEMALLGGGRRTATVTTGAPTRVLVLFGEDFRRLQAAHPAIAERIQATVRDRADPDRACPESPGDV
jgi:CRP-like cAMP-binding protein